MDSIEERKRIAQQRQQAKMRESFQASKNKSLNPDGKEVKHEQLHNHSV